ncbi:unnamed protein product [Tilletia controversa]|uniref:Uncharacterized protein n=3 Tax=Tilletia TaxID=13289 RepID=A0A8X7MM97_9BASI|nr:hypothetical protein CF336_g7097 [Tilletia laevis]KAE8187030.1 hypothetical protein CF328_g7044 [Tilletia controversa]KAE8248529.1 hypothetical protein A4X03_0g6758 [Tilletia caries]KAE8188842.1 hypothetical protein CF335_g6779 [Tilletia laevis]KAE8241204.1 hypothetical protein A4X06_0g7623 [Tilletia controversa]
MHAALPLLALATAATAVSVPATLQTRQFGALGALVSGLSSPCIGNIAGLALSGDLSDCLGLSSALGIFTSLGSGDSLTPAIQGYLADNICPKDACSSSVLSDTKSKVASSCNSDDRASNNGVNLVTGLELIVNNYTQIRNIACLKQSNSNDYCVTDTLQLYEDQTKSNVTVSKLISLVSDPSSLISSLSNPTAFCTSCVDAISSVVFGTALGGPFIANSSDSTLKNGLVQGCGASYDDSSIPSDVSESFSNSTSSTTGSSSSSTPAPSSSSSQPANAAAPGLSMSAINFVAPVTLALGAIAGVLVVL